MVQTDPLPASVALVPQQRQQDPEFQRRYSADHSHAAYCHECVGTSHEMRFELGRSASSDHKDALHPYPAHSLDWGSPDVTTPARLLVVPGGLLFDFDSRVA